MQPQATTKETSHEKDTLEQKSLQSSDNQSNNESFESEDATLFLMPPQIETGFPDDFKKLLGCGA